MYRYPALQEARARAAELGLPAPVSSQTYPYKLEVRHRGRVIRFGHRDYEDFLLHRNEERRQNWRARMRQVRMRSGKKAHKEKTSPLFWAWHILW
jgi:hypothetical protein